MTPPVAWSVATRFVVSADPTFCRLKSIVTVSPGSTKEFSGVQLSAAMDAPAGAITGATPSTAFDTTSPKS
jgi:hypothetical protein